jgi:hypothetical protein
MNAVSELAAPQDSSEPRVKVLYIMGWGRSGSTIMDNLLGGIDGFFSVGELGYLWERGLVEGRRCGCGRLLRDCEVWSEVLGEGFGAALGSEVDPEEIVGWQRDVVRVRHTWRLLRFAPEQPTGLPPLDAYITVERRLYQALARVTGARVIVDSTKRPSDAALLRLLPGVDPYYVQLVRDPRAVAYSWRRRKAQPDRQKPADLVQHGPLDSTLSWVGWNAAAEALRRRHDPQRSLLLRYEDFVSRPREALVAMTELVGEDGAAIPIEGERTAVLGRNHTVSGNPSRFKTGPVELRADDEWLARQRAGDRAVATALSLPLLRRYGYPLRPRAVGDD